RDIGKPHCTCLMRWDREHAVRWRRSRRGEKWEIRSLVERLKALEHTDLPIPTSTASRAVPTSVAADRSRTLIHWFNWLRMRLHSWRHRAAREVTEIRADGSSATSRIGLAPSPLTGSPGDLKRLGAETFFLGADDASALDAATADPF